ncbi:SAM-dependent methyltransferase [bacterium (candidate division B38) B3_B38]|nr:MAG: SAM-dependent methyltransferase [bacterium (candidate division B38) B3_B38]
MKKILIGFLFALLFVFPSKGTIQEYDLDVPYVPTPYEVVTEMLRLADIGKDDVLYDLGSGDGRIVITAAKKMGCRGIGVEIAARRIKQSRENAVKEKVTDRVKFLQQDMFEADISKATVVAIYLLQSVNLKLRPKLLRELKPGTRIVSHNYSMGEWKPDKTSEVNIE